jgi:hypothetical protein
MQAYGMQGVVKNMLPNELELQSQALGELDSLRQPLTTSSKFKQKKKKGNPNPLSVKQNKGKKKNKRVGPALRNARLAAAAGGEAVGAAVGGGNVGGGEAPQLPESGKPKTPRRKREKGANADVAGV